MKILLLDIETRPDKVYTWSFFKTFIGLKQVVEDGGVICWGAKWLGEKEVMFSSVHETTRHQMLKDIRKLLNEADAVVHWNGTDFDIPWLNTEFVLNGMKPPAPFKQIDLMRAARKKFRFPSYKLSYVSRVFGVRSKVSETDFDLWKDCMAGNEKAWKKMKTYNINDVLVLEDVYFKMLPWIPNHPNYGSYQDDKLVCPNCGGKHYQKRGTATAHTMTYQRYQCQAEGCGHWFRGNKPLTNRGMEKFLSVNS